MKNNDLTTLFNPNSIAVVGVSENTSKLGSVVFNNILKGGFEGKVYPVNPKYPALFGYKCYAKIAAIEEKVDLAVIVIPAEFVFDAIKDCAEKKVSDAIIISAGFGETGAEGEKMEKEITSFAKEHGIRILGPNCLGIIIPKLKLNASFAPQIPDDGNVAFLSQSGAFNTAILDLAEQNKLGFSHFISIGNKSDLNEQDFVMNFMLDEEVKVLGIYLEEFEDGKDFIDLIKSYELKPTVLLHPGESVEARKAISSHTGSLAGSSDVIKAALRQTGITQVYTIEKMFAAMMMFSWGKLPKGDKIAIVTNAGGPGIMLTDMVVKEGLKLAELTEETQTELKKVLPTTASVHNPVDVIGDAQVDRYSNAIQILEKDPNVDVIVVLLTPQLVTQIEETAKFIINFYETSSKTIVPIFIGGNYVQAGLSRFFDHKVPAFQFPEEAIHSIKNLVEFYKFVNSTKEKINISKSDSNAPLINKGLTDQPVAMSQELAKKLAEEFDLTMPKEAIVKSLEEAEGFAQKHGYPIVLKALAEDIMHKTDVKALFLDISNWEELSEAYENLQENITKATGKASAEVLIQEQIKGGEELFIGANRDGNSEVYDNGKGFGHLLVFGKGGIYTEVYKDISNALIPISEKEIENLINETKVSKIINGTRGKKPLALGALIKTINKIQRLLVSYPQIVSLDINPVILTEERCIVVDLKCFIQK